MQVDATKEPQASPQAERKAAAEGQYYTRIEPINGWRLPNFLELWRFRELIYCLAWRDLKVRYKQTVLGIAWAVLQPLLMMIVFTIIFGRMAKLSSGDLPYPLFALAGLLPWFFFSTAVTNCANSVIASERLVTKIYFPRLAIPLAALGAAAVDSLVALGLLAVLMAYYQVAPGIGLLLLPVVYATVCLAALGVGTGLAALTVTYRDFRYVTPFFMQLWMFATPTVYMATSATTSEGHASLWLLNPMTGLIAAFRAVCLGGEIPWLQFAVAAQFAVLLVFAGAFYFRRVEDRFADII